MWRTFSKHFKFWLGTSGLILSLLFCRITLQRREGLCMTNVQRGVCTFVQGSTALKSQTGFKFTVDNPLLTNEQRQFYEENGYIIIRNLIDHELLDECSQRFVDICDGVVSSGQMLLMKDISFLKSKVSGQNAYYKIQDIFHDDVFSKYIKHERLLDYVECFTGPDITALHTMLINKPPDSGKNTTRHPLHQDLFYFPIRPADRIVAAWTAIENVSLDNGCLVVVPGSHDDPSGGVIVRHFYPKWEGGVNKAFYGILGSDEYETLPLIMEKGDTVFFHPLLIHGSGSNTTRGFRKAICCHYATSNFRVIDVKGTIQEDIVKETEEIYRKKGLRMNLPELWRYKSQLVRGRPGAFSRAGCILSKY